LITIVSSVTVMASVQVPDVQGSLGVGPVAMKAFGYVTFAKASACYTCELLFLLPTVMK